MPVIDIPSPLEIARESGGMWKYGWLSTLDAIKRSRAIAALDLLATGLGFAFLPVNAFAGVLTITLAVSFAAHKFAISSIEQRDVARVERDRVRLGHPPNRRDARWLLFQYADEGRRLRRRLTRNRAKRHAGALIGEVGDWDWRFRNAVRPLHTQGNWSDDPRFGNLFKESGINSTQDAVLWLDARLERIVVLAQTGH